MGIAVKFSAETARKIIDFNFQSTAGQRGTGSGVISSLEYTPAIGEECSAYDTSGTLVWGGTIDKILRTRIGATGATEYLSKFNVVSLEQRMDRRLCGPTVYTGLAGGAMLKQLVDTECAGELIFTTGPSANIGVGASAADMGVCMFAGKTVAEAADDIAARSGYIWFIRPDSGLWFIPKGDAGPTTLEVNSGSKNYFEPDVTENRLDYYNKGRIAIAWEAFAATEETFTGDGTAVEWDVALAIDNIVSIELNGVVQEVGIKDRDTEKNFYYTFGLKKIWQETADPVLTSADTIVIKYYGVGGNIITYSVAADIAARAAVEAGTGIYEMPLVEDYNIKDSAVGTKKIEGMVKRYNPSLNGAPAGTVPKEYTWKMYSWRLNAEQLRVGNTVIIEWENPTTGGPKLVVVHSLSGRLVGGDYFDENFGTDETAGYWEYSITAYEYVEMPNEVDFMKAIAGGSGVLSSAPSSIGGGSGGAGTINSYVIKQTLTGTYNVVSPSGTIADGDRLTVILIQDATGGRAVTWSADFELASQFELLTDPNTKSTIDFVGSSGKWWMTSVPVTNYL